MSVNLLETGLLSANLANVVSRDVTISNPGGTTQLNMICNDTNAQSYTLFAPGVTGGALTDGNLALWSYNNQGANNQIMQIVPQTSVADATVIFNKVSVNTLSVTGALVGKSYHFSVTPQSIQYIGGLASAPTVLCSFTVPTGSFYQLYIQSISSATTYTPVTAFAANLYLSDTANVAYDATKQFQAPYVFNIGAENPRVTPVPIASGGLNWSFKASAPLTTLYLNAVKVTSGNLCQANAITMNGMIVVYN